MAAGTPAVKLKKLKPIFGGLKRRVRNWSRGSPALQQNRGPMRRNVRSHIPPQVVARFGRRYATLQKLQCCRSSFLIANADRVVDAGEKNLPVPNLPGRSGSNNGLHRGLS